MPADRALVSLQAAAARRLTPLDPLLPGKPVPEQVFSGPSANSFRCDVQLMVTGPGGGEPLAAGRCAHWTGIPGSLDLVWGASRRFTLFPEIAGPDVAGPLDQLIGQWRDHLTALPEAAGDDTAAIINWPSRDLDGLNVLLRHGLTPLTVVAARPFARAGRTAGRTASRIRRANPSDLDVIAQFGLAEINYDAHFGAIIERSWAGPAIRQYLAELLAEPEPWVWVAETETEGTPLGLLAAEPPDTAGWIAPLTARSPVAYLMTAFVAPSARGTGVGGQLADEFHAAADAAGVELTLLHYELLNPRSGPFWSQQGYRPLWTCLEARPARQLH